MPEPSTVYVDDKTLADNAATETTVAQLVMAVDNPIDQIAYDLNAAAFSETSSITNDYILDNVEFNFSTNESKKITITSSDGTKLYEDTTLDQHIVINNQTLGIAYSANENFTIVVSQFNSAGTMDCIARIIKGTNSLLGDPEVVIKDSSGNKVETSNAALKTCPEEHHTSFTEEYTSDSGGDISATTIITPTSGKKIAVHLLAICTEANSGTVSLDFTTSSKKVARLYASRSSVFAAAQTHDEGNINEVLTLTGSGLGNTRKVFVNVQYIEES